MFDKRISKYLQKIELGEAFNYSVFLSLLPEDLREEVEYAASKKFLGKNAIVVDIPDHDLLNRLKLLTVEPKDRVDATLQGDSHRAKTSTSYLFAYHQYTTDIHPDTVICNKEAAYCSFQPKQQLVIVENSELFFARQTLFKKMNRVFSPSLSSELPFALSFENSDLVFGAGNQISNQYNRNFIDRYDSVLCFFDYDLGGLKIFKAMKNMLGDKAIFLEPDSNRLGHLFVKQPKSQEQYLKALEAAKSLGLRKLHQLLLDKKLFMEQEALLALSLGAL